jgi:hypothetical protein
MYSLRVILLVPLGVRGKGVKNPDTLGFFTRRGDFYPGVEP